MPLFERKPPLPAELAPRWRAFLDCGEVIEAGRRTLLSTLPVGRVEPAPVSLGVEALATALTDAGGWMAGWAEVDALAEDHADCLAAIAEAQAGLARVTTVAAQTRELEELQGAVDDVIAPLDAFADAERTWRRTWKIPR